MSGEPIPFACDLSRLSPEQRSREKALLGRLKERCTAATETDRGWRLQFPATEEPLADAGRLLALERLCCPFLEFRLEVGAGDLASLEIFGREGAKPFIVAEFLP